MATIEIPFDIGECAWFYNKDWVDAGGTEQQVKFGVVCEYIVRKSGDEPISIEYDFMTDSGEYYYCVQHRLCFNTKDKLLEFLKKL